MQRIHEIDPRKELERLVRENRPDRYAINDPWKERVVEKIHLDYMTPESAKELVRLKMQAVEEKDRRKCYSLLRKIPIDRHNRQLTLDGFDEWGALGLLIVGVGNENVKFGAMTAVDWRQFAAEEELARNKEHSARGETCIRGILLADSLDAAKLTYTKHLRI